jgi:hypothetical protein
MFMARVQLQPQPLLLVSSHQDGFAFELRLHNSTPNIFNLLSLSQAAD